MRVVRLLYFACFTLLLPFTLGPANRASAQEIKISNNVVASSVAGWHPLYQLYVNPENAASMISCGARFDPKDNAFYGFVYSSSDGGKSWRQTLEDRSSTFESEQSCAFGIHGIAYFVASASKVIDGEPHHDLGSTRIFVSRDSGESWKLGTTTGWTDYSTSVVDTHPGPNQNRLYVFFNNLHTFYSSIGENERAAAEEKANTGTRVGMITYREGDASAIGPFSADAMRKEGYHGSYPAPAFVLKDGSIITFFTAKRRTQSNAREFMANVVRVDATRSGLEPPVTVVDLTPNPHETQDTDCGGLFLGSAAAYDLARDRLYFAYPDVSGKRCQLFLTTSGDGGRSWSQAKPMRSPDQSISHQYENPELAVNSDGTFGVLWQDRERSGCWIVAASVDGGESLTHGQTLGSCSNSKGSPLNTAFLWTSFFQADPKQSASTIRINLRNANNSVWRNSSGLVATPDGAFHPIWIDAENGSGEVRTAEVRVSGAESLVSASTHQLVDITHSVTLLYGGDQFYDSKSHLLTLKIALRNDGAKPIYGPIRIAAPALYSHCGRAEITNSENKAIGAGAVWNVTTSVPNGTLEPGATSKPISLRFHYALGGDVKRESDDILGIDIKIYGTTQKVADSTLRSNRPIVAALVRKEAHP